MIFSYQKPLSGKRVGVVFGSFALCAINKPNS